MVNHYTARKRLRSDDAYTPGGQAGFRPDYPTIVYTRILKQLFPETPVVIGGIEASMRRITHYDYWQDQLRPSFLLESGADLLVYGMGEKPILEIARQFEKDPDPRSCRHIPQISYLCGENPLRDIRTGNKNLPDVVLSSHETCLENKKAQARNFALVETASNQIRCGRIIQKAQGIFIVINPPFPVETGSHDIDRSFDLPYTRLPHPRYKNRGEIPAFVMIRNSVNLHRGCFGGCAFCTISAHQGKQVQSRSEESILEEVRKICRMPYFKGHLSDLGGPSANMYGMHGKDPLKCLHCKRPSCLFPGICPNLDHDHGHVLELYKKVCALPGVESAYIGSGIRYDMLIPYLEKGKGKSSENHAREYVEWVIENAVSGRLKVAPEHTEDTVLQKMRKMPFSQFETFKDFFDLHNRKIGKNQQLIPYFISAHPGCRLLDMQALENKTRHLGYRLEQVQLFTPTPMTLSTETYYTELDPYTLQPVFVEKDPQKRDRQTNCFFWYKKDRTQPHGPRRTEKLSRNSPQGINPDRPSVKKNGKTFPKHPDRNKKKN